jgi:3-phenylpropionate/cinnamic acid dioxygenase small subunit
VTCTCNDQQQVIRVLNRYALCLDNRDWQGLEDVFVEEATASYGGRPVTGRPAVVEWVSRFLDVCGPTQHLLGNYEIQIEGDRATSTTQARVVHVGAGDRARLTPYESIGTYSDQLVRTARGWRIAHRDFDVRIQLGDPAILAPIHS